LPRYAGISGSRKEGGLKRSLLTCSPNFVDLALNELRRSCPEAEVLQTVAPGYSLLQAPYSFDVLTSPWRHHLPVYLHHLFPVHAIVELNPHADLISQLKPPVQRLSQPDAVVQVRSIAEHDLRCSVPEIQQQLTMKQLPCNDTPTGRVLSVLIAKNVAYLGLSWSTQNLSPWAGGQIPIIESVSNRAGYKLLEALHTFGISLRQGDQALDLGASPGAWTTLLRRRGLHVTAVAPTPLYPWLEADPEVTYHPRLAEEFLGNCNTTFALIVNDMKLDAQDSARLMVDYARHLRSEGIAIMTLKLREQNKLRVMDHAFRLLRKEYKIIRVRQLVSNQKEVTLFLRRKV
jgi:23S rRNA (cytidine2498-2'-O)-methyltransferase